MARGINTLDRALAMHQLYATGATLQEVGDRFGVSRERVRQILCQHCGGHEEQKFRVKKRIQKRTRDREQKKRQERNDRCLAKNGCTWEQYQTIVGVGRSEAEMGASPERLPIRAFITQRRNARIRGVGWELTLWEWWNIWAASGQWDQRGRGKGYVMSRVGDVGPYAVGNVFIQTGAENTRDGILRYHRKARRLLMDRRLSKIDAWIEKRSEV